MNVASQRIRVNRFTEEEEIDHRAEAREDTRVGGPPLKRLQRHRVETGETIHLRTETPGDQVVDPSRLTNSATITSRPLFYRGLETWWRLS